ncbi:MAG: hypothetical protein JXK04_04860 [Campylobacterales bacterium]|nr:hypothetical protein [Campylobacterales bacterium]
MNIQSKKTLVVAGILAAAMNLSGGEIDGGAVLGSAIGAAAGTAVGSAVGGKDGAIIGGGVGGALGAAAGSKSGSAESSARVNVGGAPVARVIVEDDYRGRHDNGLHKGHYKNKHKGRGRD